MHSNLKINKSEDPEYLAIFSCWKRFDGGFPWKSQMCGQLGEISKYGDDGEQEISWLSEFQQEIECWEEALRASDIPQTTTANAIRRMQSFGQIDTYV